jgi:hypothetical protein
MRPQDVAPVHGGSDAVSETPEETIARLTAERDQAREECGKWKHMHELSEHCSTTIRAMHVNEIAELKATIAAMTDDLTRCACCGWPLASAIDAGCVPGNCSQRPILIRMYSPARYAKEKV